MPSETSPVVAGFAVLLIFLFIVLLITWCCKQFSRTKESSVNLIPHVIPPRYITTIDVQTGLPVVIDVTNLNSHSRNQVRIVPQQRRVSCPINARSNATLYGTMAQGPNSYCDVLPRTPPPPYSEVAIYPPSTNRT